MPNPEPVARIRSAILTHPAHYDPAAWHGGITLLRPDTPPRNAAPLRRTTLSVAGYAAHFTGHTLEVVDDPADQGSCNMRTLAYKPGSESVPVWIVAQREERLLEQAGDVVGLAVVEWADRGEGGLVEGPAVRVADFVQLTVAGVGGDGRRVGEASWRRRAAWWTVLRWRIRRARVAACGASLVAWERAAVAGSVGRARAEWSVAGTGGRAGRPVSNSLGIWGGWWPRTGCRSRRSRRSSAPAPARIWRSPAPRSRRGSRRRRSGRGPRAPKATPRTARRSPHMIAGDGLKGQVSSRSSTALRAGMTRLLTGRPERTDGRLTKENLW
ncbi:hypothetical protein SUDANB105_00023 [Streptomyces sp. enrichment culture]